MGEISCGQTLRMAFLLSLLFKSLEDENESPIGNDTDDNIQP